MPLTLRRTCVAQGCARVFRCALTRRASLWREEDRRRFGETHAAFRIPMRELVSDAPTFARFAARDVSLCPRPALRYNVRIPCDRRLPPRQQSCFPSLCHDYKAATATATTCGSERCSCLERTSVRGRIRESAPRRSTACEGRRVCLHRLDLRHRCCARCSRRRGLSTRHRSSSALNLSWVQPRAPSCTFRTFSLAKSLESRLRKASHSFAKLRLFSRQVTRRSTP